MTPTNSHDGEASSTTQSQHIPGGNSSSRQAIDASIHTRDTPSNTREETAVNQSPHPGFTAPVHGIPPPASLPVPDSALSSQRAETVPTLHSHGYIDYPGACPISSSDRVGSTTSGIADRHVYTLPPLQEITEHSVGTSTPSRYPVSGLMSTGRRGGDVQGLSLRWQPDAELVRQQEITARTTPVTGHSYIGYPGTTEMSLNGQVGSATSSVVNRHTLNSLPSAQEVDEQPAVRVLTPAPFSVLNPAALGQRTESVPKLPPGRQPDAELVPRRESIAQTASFRLSPEMDNSTLTEAEEASFQQRAENYPGFHARTLFETNQGYGDVSVGDSAWDGSSYDTQIEGLNPEFWNINFPLYN